MRCMCQDGSYIWYNAQKEKVMNVPYTEAVLNE
jgi:hypothetical protein